MEALERLKKGKPRHPDVKEKASTGRILVSFTNVALEAGVSRRLVASDGCPYPIVRASIIAFINSAPKASATASLVRELRAEIRDLKKQLELSDTYNAELLLEFRRISKDRGGNVVEDGVVTKFRKDRRRRKTESEQ